MSVSPTILFFADNQNHRRIFVPVIERLQAMGARTRAELVVLDAFTSRAAPMADEQNRVTVRVPANPAQRTLDDHSFVQYLSARSAVRAAVDVCWRLIVESGASICVFPTDLSPVFRRLIARCNPGGVITVLVQDGHTNSTCHPPPLRRALAVGSHLLRGWDRDSRPRSPIEGARLLLRAARQLFPGTPHGFGSNGCQHLLVMGEATRQVWIRRGTPAERIHVVGHPAMDRDPWWIDLPTPQSDREYLFAAQALEADKLLSTRQELGLYRQMLGVFAEYPGIRLTFRPHPRMRPTMIDWIRSQAPANTSVRGDEPLRLQMARAHTLVTFSSTLFLEAFLAGRTVYILDWPGIPYRLLPFRNREIVRVPSPRDLRELLDDPKRARGPDVVDPDAPNAIDARDELYLDPNEPAAARIAAFLDRLLESGRA